MNTIELGDMDWALLRAQKRMLLELQARSDDTDGEMVGDEWVTESRMVEGIINLLDHIQDQCPESEAALDEHRFTVVDLDSASKPGEIYTVVTRFDTLAEAEAYVAHLPNTEDVERGRYGIDGPSW